MDWNSCFTAARFGQEGEEVALRSAFERDYDRIIFSSPFRRLQNKTQVFPLPDSTFVHNRLTHSLEVVSVGRSLGQMVGTALVERHGLKGEAADFYSNQLKVVISAACLAHDLGNPAFGHSGEEAISKYFLDRQGEGSFTSRFSPAQWADLTAFEGNANAFRILTRQFNGRASGGYRLTYSTLAALLKYPCSSLDRDKKAGKHRSKYGFFQSDKPAFEKVVRQLNLPQDSRAEQAYYRHPFVYLVEAADDICYNIIDYEDAHRLGILSFAEVRDAMLSIIELKTDESRERLQSNLHLLRHDPNEAVAYLRSKAINVLVESCAEVFLNHGDSLLSGQFGKSLLSASKASEVMQAIEKNSVERIYQYPSVLKIELAGFKIMSGLIEDFLEAALLDQDERQGRHKRILKLLPSQFQFAETDSPYEKTMAILDHISAMSDGFALETYRNLRGISIPKI